MRRLLLCLALGLPAAGWIATTPGASAHTCAAVTVKVGTSTTLGDPSCTADHSEPTDTCTHSTTNEAGVVVCAFNP